MRPVLSPPPLMTPVPPDVPALPAPSTDSLGHSLSFRRLCFLQPGACVLLYSAFGRGDAHTPVGC